MTNEQVELDLFQLFRVLKKYKASIFFLIATSICFGLIFNVFYKPQFDVKVEYSYNYFPLGIHQQCKSNLSCKKELFDQKILSAFEFEWIKDRNFFSTTSTQPLKEKEYYSYFDKLNKNLISQINAETLNSFDYFEQISINKEQSEIFTEYLLYARNLSHQISTGAKPVTFHSLEIKTKTSKYSILVFAFIIGVFLSIAQSLVRNSYENYKNKSF